MTSRSGCGCLLDAPLTRSMTIERLRESQHKRLPRAIVALSLVWYFFPRMSFAWRLALAVGIEAAWEIVENTPMVIKHYREQALAQGYTGDSILNSISDTLAMIGGFLMARKLPVWGIIAVALFLALYVGYETRDNFTLNIINLLHPLDFIATWQSGM